MSKKYIMQGLVDIHAHLLPVQDGPESYQEALDALQSAADAGIKRMILTPHYFTNDRRYDKASIEEAFEKLQQHIEAARIPIKVYLGNELNIERSVIEALESKRAMTLAGTPYILAEYPFHQVPCDYTSVIYELMCHGYRPIIAHPERNAFIQSGYESLVELKSMGCLIQINAASLLGDYGGTTMKYAFKFLKEGLADFIASDAHSCQERPPDVLSRCMKKLPRLSQEYIESLFEGKAMETIFLENNRP